MGEYRQSCPHLGRRLSAQRDIDRNEARAAEARVEADLMHHEANTLGERIRQAEAGRIVWARGAPMFAPDEDDEQQLADWKREMERCRDDAHDLERLAARADRRAQRATEKLAALPDGAGCHLCAGANVVRGNGSAQIGGPARRNDTYGDAA